VQEGSNFLFKHLIFSARHYAEQNLNWITRPSDTTWTSDKDQITPNQNPRRDQPIGKIETNPNPS
jgi:hypothetical protein